MPIWTCPNCGERAENFGWDEAPWKKHVCREKKEEFALPDISQNQDEPLPPKRKKNNLFDFL